MADIKISSSSFPFMGDHTKIMVNKGVWFLFKINILEKPKASYLLIVERDSYYLDDRGNIISIETNKLSESSNREVVYFSDIPQPKSISNFSFA